MTNLQSLSIFLTERLMLAAQEIFKAVEVTVTEYHDEISRSRQENELLKTRLVEAGIQLYPESQLGLSVLHGDLCAESDRGDPVEKVQVKQEPRASQEEPCVAPPQTSVPEEPVSPSACLEEEKKLEEMMHPQMTDSSRNPLLKAHQCMQIKEESNEPKSGVGAEIFCGSQSSTSDDLSNTLAASNNSSELETELDRFSSIHNASELPLTSSVNAGQPKRCTNYDPAEQDQGLQRIERYPMIRARETGQLPKGRRERKMEQRIEDQGPFRKKEKLPEVLMLDEEQYMPRQLCASMNERDLQPGHKPSAVYQSEPEANLCVVCGRSFSSRGLLKVHLRVHSGERPYHCPYCDKNFRQSSHLSVHIRIHTGEKPYSCLSCGKRFSDRSACNRHVKAHLENAELGQLS